MPPPLPNAVTFWIKAFIPDPSMSPLHVFPAPGTSAGKSMIVVPAPITGFPIPTTRAFLGDNRGFSSDVNASARIHSLAEFTNLNNFVPSLREEIRCGESHEIHMVTGNVIARATAPTNRIRFLHLRGNTTVDPIGGVITDSPSVNYIQLDYEAAANLPLLTGSPDIDMVGIIAIDRDARRFRFRGKMDSFPAFEAYVSFGAGPPITLFTLQPVAPEFLIGDVDRPVDVTVSIP